ncbi:MAG TPA: hypothetical protein VK155_01285 [Bacteroidales bacterium]|nr:hypothetical protein [Bacteroidales bacterium]
MRTGNTTDGMYLILILIPVIIGILTGDSLRRKIMAHPLCQNNLSSNSCRLAGSFAEIFIIFTGIATGFLLISLV